jgi:hypothetical protein
MSVVIGMMLIGVISIPVLLKKYHARVGAT